jgi:hypothetical protein
MSVSTLTRPIALPIAAELDGKRYMPVYASDFSVGTGWTASNGTLLTNQTVGGRTACLGMWANSTEATHQLNGYSVVAGNRYRILFDYYIPEGNTNVNGIGINARGYMLTVAAPTLGVWGTIDTGNYLCSGSGVLLILQRKAGGSSFAGANSETDDLMYIRNVYVHLLKKPGT